MTVPSAALCGYDVHRQGDRARQPIEQRRPPCRRKATHVVPFWLDDDGDDLYVCPLHAAAMVKRNPHDHVDPERIREAA